MLPFRILLLWLGCTCSLSSMSQVQEDFQDGNFTTNPAWSGNSGDWAVNPGYQLQSGNQVANSTFYLSTPNTMAIQTQWEFYVRLNFNPSGVNYVDVFLAASASDLGLGSTTGYFVRIGNTQDEISLYRKDLTGTAKLIDGMDASVNSSDNILRIKVIRNAGHQFTLFRDAGNTGYYTSEGSIIDATYLSSFYFGILVRQSTAGFFQKHFFDDVVIETYIPDILPPEIISATPISVHQLDVLFSETVDPASSIHVTNYFVNNGIGSPITAQNDPVNHALVHLDFTHNFSNGINHTLHINGVNDISGNTLINGTVTFSFYKEQRFDVLIDEIMADPVPHVGLPTAEFIELKNMSGRMLNLSGWKIMTSSTVANLTSSHLPPDSFLILTSTSNESLFSVYGRVLGITGFPSLDNNGTVLSLVSKEGVTIHAVPYKSEWYLNPVKSDGGWSLEMIDPKTPCSGAGNWKASIDVRGGTPGIINSIDNINTDQAPPRLVRTFCPDSVTIIAFFDEPLDSLSALNSQSFSLDNYTGIITSFPQAPLFNEVHLLLSIPLVKTSVHLLTVNQVKDCEGNSIGGFNQVKTGLAEAAVAGDLVINEMLFHPRANAFDYVECYNKSSKVLDASDVLIASRNGLGNITTPKKMNEEPFAIFPGDHIVITEDASSLKMQYLVRNPDQVLIIPSLPSWPNDKGNIIVVNSAGDIIDEVNYSEKWHFALISNTEGVSLERLDPLGSSSDRNNWHSAAATSGYGTPTYKNSQNRETHPLDGIIDVNPKIFSPDNDGHDDFFIINYRLNETGYLANISIFDASGRPVRYFVKNELLGRAGSWKWDGLDENNRLLTSGFYIVFIEFFNLQGKTKKLKYSVVLAR